MNQQIIFQCQCGAVLRVPATAAGRKGKCKHCTTRLIVPEQSNHNGMPVEAAAENRSPPTRSAPPPMKPYREMPTAMPETVDPKPTAPPPNGSPRSGSPAEPSSYASEANASGSSELPFATAVDSTTSNGKAEIAESTVEQLCSICQTSIYHDEPRTSCDQCDLPFHEECWEENLGCSAYGCSNVNLLKAGPDIRIDRPPPLPTAHMAPSHYAAQPSADEIPWGYLLLAASALAAMLSLLTYGVFSLIAGALSVVYFLTNPQRMPVPIFIACMVVSVIGFFMGMIVSVNFWS